MEGVDASDAKFVPFPDIPGADCMWSRCVFEDMQLAADRERALEFRFYETSRSECRARWNRVGVAPVLL